MRSMRSSVMSGHGRRAGALGAAAIALSLAACSDDGIQGPDGNGGDDTSPVTFYVGNPVQGASSLAASLRASLVGSLPPVDPEAIASLEIVVSLIEAHRAGPENSASGTPRWVDIPLDPPVVIDPATLEAGEFQVMATADIPEGDYDIVRLIPESVTVQFQTSSSTTPIVVGKHEYDPAPATHEVTVPSGRITIPTANFAVGAGGGLVLIVWDPEETAATVNATGSGKILLKPVFNEGSQSAKNQIGG